MENVLQLLPEALLPWYREHKRELPWRQTKEPYHVWLSEIMLQQTRVEAVKGYYARFLNALPTVEALANCDDDALHKLWEGLGYYSRVRNLKKAAIRIGRPRRCIPREIQGYPGAARHRRLYRRCGLLHLLQSADTGSGWKCAAGGIPADRG